MPAWWGTRNVQTIALGHSRHFTLETFTDEKVRPFVSHIYEITGEPGDGRMKSKVTKVGDFNNE